MEEIVRNGYTFQESFHDAMSELSNAQYGRVMRAINEYALYGKEPTLNGIELMIWKLVYPQLRKSRNKANGKAGAPTGNQNAKKEQSKNKQKTIKKQSKNNQTENKKQSNLQKELPLSSPLEESSPAPPKEDNPPIIPQEKPLTRGSSSLTEDVSTTGASVCVEGSKAENSMARKVFETHYREVFETEYYWTAKDAGQMSKLLQKIRFARSQRNLPIDTPSMMAALKAFLSSIQDGWIFENFSVSTLTSKYNEICAKAQAELNSKQNGFNRTTNSESERQRRQLDIASRIARLSAEDDAGA